MRRLLLAAVSAASVLAIIGPAAAATQDRYCLQGRQWGYPGSCAFSTFAQCAASASGTDSSCGINPMAANVPERQQRPVPRR
jgi:hypothetical protein